MSLADELKKLAELKDAGVLTQDEFNAQKQKLLDGGGSAAPAPAPSQPVEKQAVVPFSLEDLRETLRDPNKKIKSLKESMWVADLSEDEVNTLVDRGWTEVRGYCVLHPDLPGQTLKKLLRDRETTVRCSVAVISNRLPQWAIDALIADDTIEIRHGYREERRWAVREALARDCNAETTIKLAKQCPYNMDVDDRGFVTPTFYLWEILSANPNLSQSIFERFAKNEEGFRLTGIFCAIFASNPGLSERAAVLIIEAEEIRWKESSSQRKDRFKENRQKLIANEGVPEHVKAQARESLSRSTCFPASARVHTPSGTRRIADLQPGDLVISYRPDGRPSLRPVTRKLQHGAALILRVALADGTALRVTANHTVLTARGWLRVDQLGEGDLLIQADGSSRVSEVWTEPTLEPVYNLHTAGEHTFVVDGVVVHNFTTFRVLRTWFHRLFIDSFWSDSWFRKRDRRAEVGRVLELQG